MTEKKHQNAPTPGEIASRRTANLVVSKSAQMYEELNDAADEVIREYRQRNKAIEEERKRRGQFLQPPQPEKRTTSPGRFGLYWRAFRPNNGRSQLSTKQIRRDKGPAGPYPPKVFNKFTDDLNRDLVLDTERRLRAIERMMKVSRDIQDAIRIAVKETDHE